MRDRCSATVRLLFFAVTSASCVLLAVESSRVARGETNPQTPAELWLSWSSESKANYVWGYLSGFEEGKRAGCSFYADKITPHTPHKPVPPEKLPRQACLNALPDFVKPSKAYVDAITIYYTKYPSDRQAGMSRILLESASPPGLSVDQIHARLSGNSKRD